MQLNYIKDAGEIIGLEVSNAENYSEFEATLQNLPSMQIFLLRNGDSGLNANESQQLVAKLSELENLESLEFFVDELENGNYNCGHDLARILNRNKICDLSLSGDVTNIDAFFEPIMQAMQSNTSLEVLYIYAQNFGPGIYKKLADIINLKSEILKEIRLDGVHIDICDADIKLLTDALANNNDIEVMINSDLLDIFPRLSALDDALEEIMNNLPVQDLAEPQLFAFNALAAGDVCESHSCQAHKPRSYHP